MEWKIGEIKQINGEWCQCVATIFGCSGCYFRTYEQCTHCSECMSKERSDKKSVIFKKLEKVGEPYRRWLSPFNNIMVQRYRLYGRNVIMPDEPCMYFNAIDNTIEIELKQTKEDMEENKLNLKPFDIQKAREGKPVCTRDGRKVRIICFDVKGLTHPIIALIEEGEDERLCSYMPNGRRYEDEEEWKDDLMMLPEKKEGWVNIVRGSNGSPHMGRGIFQSKEEAENAIKAFSDNLIDTVKISWEE